MRDKVNLMNEYDNMQYDEISEHDRCTSVGILKTGIVARCGIILLCTPTLLMGIGRAQGILGQSYVYGMVVQVVGCVFLLASVFSKGLGFRVTWRIVLVGSMSAILFALHFGVEYPVIAKNLGMLLYGVVVPMCLCSALGPREGPIAVFRMVSILSLFFVMGSVFMPSLLYVPSRETYSAIRCGWFVNPNTYGAAAMFGFFGIVLWLSFRARTTTIWRVVAVVLCVVCLFALYRSRSRACVLGVAVFLSIQILMRAGMSTRLTARKQALWIGLSLIVFVLVAFAVPAAMSNDFGTFMNKDIQSGSGRFGLWHYFLDDYRRQGFLAQLAGQGYGAVFRVAWDYGYSGSHNAYIEALIESGAIGLGVLVLCSVRTLHHFFNDARLTNFGIGLFAVFAAMLVHSVFESHLFGLGTTVSGLCFFSFLGYRSVSSEARAMQGGGDGFQN